MATTRVVSFRFRQCFVWTRFSATVVPCSTGVLDGKGNPKPPRRSRRAHARVRVTCTYIHYRLRVRRVPAGPTTRPVDRGSSSDSVASARERFFRRDETRSRKRLRRRRGWRRPSPWTVRLRFRTGSDKNYLPSPLRYACCVDHSEPHGYSRRPRYDTKFLM